MTTDQTSGAGAFKAAPLATDRRDDAVVGRTERDFKAPFHLEITRDREFKLDGRQTAIAAGALGLGYLAYRGVSALLGRRPSRDSAPRPDVRPEPLAVAPAPDVKDNAAPRFAGEDVSAASGAPFVAASSADDTGDLLIEVTEIDIVSITPLDGGRVDNGADGPEHVPTDLMADRDVGAGDRAIDAFRPDPTAPVPDAMRESLRPATGPAKAFAADRGDFASGLSQTDGSK